MLYILLFWALSCYKGGVKLVNPQNFIEILFKTFVQLDYKEFPTLHAVLIFSSNHFGEDSFHFWTLHVFCCCNFRLFLHYLLPTKKTDKFCFYIQLPWIWYRKLTSSALKNSWEKVFLAFVGWKIIQMWKG